jgi:hypothetical protein
MSLSKDQKKQLNEILERWRSSPVDFVYEAIGIKNRMKEFPNDDLTRQQKDFLELLGKYRNAKVRKAQNLPLSKEDEEMASKIGFTIRAGQGPGKTTALSWAIIWFLCTHYDSIAPCFAPKMQQLVDNLWKEIGVWIETARQYGSPIVYDNLVMQSGLVYHKGFQERKEKWAAIAKSVKDTANREEQGDTARGIHADYAMICIDEAPGVKEGLFDVLGGTITGPINFIIMIGNPNKNFGYFYDSHNKNKHQWVALHWSNEDCERIPLEIIQQREREWGRDSSRFQTNVLGNFPFADKDEYIPVHLIQEAMNEENDIMSASTDPIMVGVDPAGRGKDSTVICQRRGGVVEAIWKINDVNEMHVANWLAMYNREMQPNAIMIDSGGLGAPIAARCEELGLPIYRVNSAETARNKEKCDRVRDELLWNLRKWFIDGSICVRLDNPEMLEDHIRTVKKELTEQLQTIRYENTDSRTEKFEKKSTHKKRLGGQSPDILDALALSFYWQDELFRDEVQLDGYSYYDYDDDDGSWMGI